MNASPVEVQLGRQLRDTERQWFQLIETVVAMAVGTETNREHALSKLCEMASDPRLARRIVMAMEADASCIGEAPELYWAAQLTLKGEKNVLMQIGES